MVISAGLDNTQVWKLVEGIGFTGGLPQNARLATRTRPSNLAAEGGQVFPHSEKIAATSMTFTGNGFIVFVELGESCVDPAT